MNLSLYQDALLELPADLLALCAFEGKLAEVPQYQEIDRALNGLLSQIVEEEQFEAKEDQTLLVHTHGHLRAARILLIGLGSRDDFDIADTQRYAAKVATEAFARRAATVGLTLPPLDPTASDAAVQFLVKGFHLGSYRFERYLSEANRKASPVKEVKLAITGVEPLALARAKIVAQAICTARDLVNEPGQALGPRALADFATRLAKDKGLECAVLGPKECEKQGMNLFLAVARGSDEEPRFIHLTYRPRGKPKRRYALVGKGVTFDSGGLSLKTATGLMDMKTDMAGAAAVLGAISALPALGLQSEVHAIVAATENMVSGSAYRVGDVFVGMSGKSVEIINTDAEGRLTLADALAYAVKLEPDEVIDLATLTGACMVALGPDTAGVMSNDHSFVERYLAASRRAGEDSWHLPLPRRLREQLKSDIADIKNLGDRWGGALTAGLFLKEFVGETPWVHVDIAGPASTEKAKDHLRPGGTGYGVATLIEYLTSRNGLA